jgi:hypothetical protein
MMLRIHRHRLAWSLFMILGGLLAFLLANVTNAPRPTWPIFGPVLGGVAMLLYSSTELFVPAERKALRIMLQLLLVVGYIGLVVIGFLKMR